MSNPIGGSLGCPTTNTVTILDNDAGFEFETANYTVAEDGGSVLISVRRGSDDESGSVTVDYATSDITAAAGADYTSVSGTLEFAPGELVKTLSIPILSDGTKENTETFRVTLGKAVGGELGVRTSATVSLQDNDPGSGFESANYSVWAGAGALTLTILRGNDGSPDPFTVDYTSSDGTVRAGVDYQAVSGTLEFAPTDMIKGIAIPILRAPESRGARTFMVTLSNCTGAFPLGTAVARVTVQRNECVVTPASASGLTIRPEAGAQTLTWTGGGTLQRADRVTGPWQTLASAPSPHRVAPQIATAFYRIAHPRPAPVYVPSSYDPATPMPLVLLLHGLGDSGQGVESYMQFRPLAERRGFLYCYPDGSTVAGNRTWNADDFSGDPPTDSPWNAVIVDDAGYLRDLIEGIARQFAVDRKRIYVAGRSSGGAMAYRMACQFADLVAAIVSHAGVSYFDSPWCVPSEPVSVLRLQSLADNYWGSPGLRLCNGYPVNTPPNPGAPRTVQEWADYNGTGEPVTEEEPTMDLLTDVPGLDTIVTRYANHPPGGAIELWTMTGGPHRPSFTMNYAPAIIDWLLAHPKP